MPASLQRQGALSEPDRQADSGAILTIRGLAERLKIGKTTVARALQDNPLVSPSTREWVQQRAKELGYVPNTVASAFLQQLRTKGSHTYRANLAFLVPRPTSATYIGRLADGARERAQELGYGVDIIGTNGLSRIRLTRMLLARGITGLIVGPIIQDVGRLALDWQRFASVTFGYSVARPVAHRIVHHHAHGIRHAFRMCRRKGFQRIGLILSRESDMRSDRQWSSAFLGLQDTLPVSERVSPLLFPEAEYSRDKIKRWVRKEKPDLVIIHSARRFPDLPEFLQSLQRPVPCVLLDWEEDDSYAGIDQQFTLMGRLLVDTLSAQILHNQRGIPHTPILSSIEGVWVSHPSLDEAAAARSNL